MSTYRASDTWVYSRRHVCLHHGWLTNVSSLAAVNFFLGIVGVMQVTRILIWQRSQKKAPVAVEVEKVKADA